MTILTYTLDQLSGQGNDMKEQFISAMVDEKLITKEIAEKMNKYVIVVTKRGYFGMLWNKLWKEDKKATLINIVKLISVS